MSKQSERLAGMMAKVHRDRGVRIMYHRGETVIGPFDATPTRPNPVAVKGPFVQIAYCDREYLIEKALLIVDGNTIEPEPGDFIVENGVRYEVAERRDGQQCFRPMDATDTFFRIYTFKR